MTPQNSGTAEKFDGHHDSHSCTPAKCYDCEKNDGELRQTGSGEWLILCHDCWRALYRY